MTVFWPRAGPSLQAQEPRLQFSQRQVFHRKLRNQGCSSEQREVFHCKLRNQGCSSALKHVFHCKLRNQGCSSAEGKSSTGNSGAKAAVLPGMNRCDSCPLFSVPHSLFSIWIVLKDPRANSVETRRVVLVNLALRTSPKFTTGVKYQFH